MKRFAKLMSLIMALVMMFSLAACGSTASDETQTTTKPTTEAKKIGLTILKEEDEKMKNNYSVIAVAEDAKWVDADGNAVKDVKINEAGADAFINWLLSEEGLKAIAEYGKKEYGTTLFTVPEDGAKADAEIAKATEETKTIRLSTTTSVNDSGLLGAIVPVFEKEYGYKVEIFSAGTGKAIANAKAGNADVILVHSKTQEEDFIKAGFARTIDDQDAERLTFMYNYFVLVGPKDDPAKVADTEDVTDAFQAIADTKSKFISRGDGSGTHNAEVKLWSENIGITAEPESFADYTDWYISANQGMGKCIAMADEQGAYVFTDKATFLTAEKNYSEFLAGLDK